MGNHQDLGLVETSSGTITIAITVAAVTAWAFRRFGQGRAQNPRSRRFKAIECFNGGASSRLPALDYEQGASSRSRQQRRIREPQARRSVDDDQIETFFCLVDDLANAARRQKVRRIGRKRAARQQPKILMLS